MKLGAHVINEFVPALMDDDESMNAQEQIRLTGEGSIVQKVKAIIRF